ncbi:N-acetylmuramoyl-L-alanine amidase [Clostridium ihumii]|uniref:N-acetylmuramoyl-L-alanine amidase n=1 Tax=Clostridium ihumii TaxID=1470356 RepID=UPI003D33DDF0
MKIGIDCGHTKYAGSSDYGTVGVRPESDLTREVGNLVISKLKQLGHTVINCTVDNCSSLGDSLGRRVSVANNNNLDFYVSIHFNCFNTKAYGTEVFTYGSKNYKQANDILNNLVALGFRNRGIKDGSELYVINSTNCESMLVEVCFCDNQSDMKIYNAEKVANAIVKGLTGQTVNNEVKVDMKTIVLYFGDMDANAAIYVAQKNKCPMMKKCDFETSGLKAEKIIQIGGKAGSTRYDSLKDASKLV